MVVFFRAGQDTTFWGVVTGFLLTHPMNLEDGMKGYDMFSNRADDVMRVVFTP